MVRLVAVGTHPAVGVHDNVGNGFGDPQDW
jgi:hypothetical protein